MKLIRATLRRSPGAVGALARLLEEAHANGRDHDLVWTLMSKGGDAKRDFLYRDQGTAPLSFLAVAPEPPRGVTDPWLIETKEYDPRFEAGQRLRFSLRANAAIRAGRGSDGAGKRHDVAMRLKKAAKNAGRQEPTRHERDAALVAWLAARGGRCGFALDNRETGVFAYRRVKRGDRVFGVADFEGCLTVTDPSSFRATLFAGIGPAKAFGCGLLLVRRA